MSDVFGKTELDRELMKFSGEYCSNCQKPVSINAKQYSTRNFGQILCYQDQQKLLAKQNEK